VLGLGGGGRGRVCVCRVCGRVGVAEGCSCKEGGAAAEGYGACGKLSWCSPECRTVKEAVGRVRGVAALTMPLVADSLHLNPHHHLPCSGCP
jgi:hypothetical protein